MKRVIQPAPASRTGIVTAAVLASSLWLAGCAGGAATAFRDPGLSMQAASEAVVIGQSSKQDVMATLGPATVVRFDSGYEVWVYRRNPLRSEAAHDEFVILFAPSGIVKKTRIRPAYGGRQALPD